MTSRALLLFALLLLGCASSPAQPTSAKPAPKVTSVERFMPLVDGTVYSYKTESEINQDKGILVFEVHRQRPDLAELRVAGRIQQLYVERDGIRHAAGGYLLKAPLSVGARWQGQFGTVTVTSMDRAIKLDSGSYTGCLETVEEVPGKKATTLYCPDVGMVSLEVVGQSGGDLGVERAVLKYYGPKVDLGSP